MFDKRKKFGRKLDKHTHNIQKVKNHISHHIYTVIKRNKNILSMSIYIIQQRYHKIKNGHTTCLLFVCYSISTKYSLFQLKNFKKNGKKTRPSNLVSHSLWDPMLEKRITNKINKQNVVE